MNGCGAVEKSRRAAPRSPPCATGAFENLTWEIMAVTVALLALSIEAAVGYPDWLTRAIGHPVIWIGRLIGVFDLALNRERATNSQRRAAGLLAILLVVGASAVTGLVIEKFLLLL